MMNRDKKKTKSYLDNKTVISGLILGDVTLEVVKNKSGRFELTNTGTGKRLFHAEQYSTIKAMIDKMIKE